MRRYLAGRLLQSLVVVLIVATASFFLAHLAPGGPFSIDDPRMTEEYRQHLHAQYGLNRPLPEQFGRYLLAVARGELGRSFSRRMPVGEVLAAALPRTLLLMGVSLAMSIVAGVAVGVYQAARRGRPAARVLGGLTLFFYSLPEFWLALMALIVFAYWLPVFPAGGIIDASIHDYLGFWGRLRDRVHHLALPAITFHSDQHRGGRALPAAAMLEVIELDFVRTARAKGLRERAVLGRHACANALLPVITRARSGMPLLVGGAVFIETVFGGLVWACCLPRRLLRATIHSSPGRFPSAGSWWSSAAWSPTCCSGRGSARPLVGRTAR